MVEPTTDEGGRAAIQIDTRNLPAVELVDQYPAGGLVESEPCGAREAMGDTADRACGEINGGERSRSIFGDVGRDIGRIENEVVRSIQTRRYDSGFPG